MSKSIDLPRVENIPELAINVEGLKRHSFMTVFVPEPSLSAEDRKLRTWLLHTVTTAARHYAKARQLIQAQNSVDQVRDGGAIFHILDVNEEIEGAVTSAYRVCMAIRRLGTLGSEVNFAENYASALENLRALRNQYEHMHEQITSNQTGRGPISMVFGYEGRKIKFRNLALETSELHALIDGAYKCVAKMYPSFNANSTPEPPGPIKLTMTASVTVIERPSTNEGNSGAV
jgi:hypothetical protein